MIVADVNVVAYLFIPGSFNSLAEQVLRRDAEWVAPASWQHEYINVLATSVRENVINIDFALRAYDAGCRRIMEDLAPLDLRAVLEAAAISRIATYDCEYVVLARRLRIPVVTEDKKLIKAFPDVGITMQAYLNTK